MVLDYALVALAISLLFGILKQFLPDFPLSDVAFQAVILYLLAKIGVIVVGNPIANFVRRSFGRPEVKLK